jgi:hypothetical protein
MKGLPRWEPEREEDNVDVDWIELDLSPLDPRDGTFRPRSFAIRVKSSSNDSEWLIHDPVDFLAQTLGKQVPELGIERGKTRVTTSIVNHHNTLSKIHLYATASTTDDGSVAVTMTKVPPTS